MIAAAEKVFPLFRCPGKIVFPLQTLGEMAIREKLSRIFRDKCESASGTLRGGGGWEYGVPPMKTALRNAYRNLPATSDAAAIARKIVSADWWPAAFRVALFRPVAPEPDIRAVYDDAVRLGFRVAFPVSSASGRYSFRFAEPDAPWREGPFGIPEPAGSSPVPRDGLRVVLVPGVAFDARGTRLGHGGGHLDSLLAILGTVKLIVLLQDVRHQDVVAVIVFSDQNLFHILNF